jgi:hypothetical protein
VGETCYSYINDCQSFKGLAVMLKSKNNRFNPLPLRYTQNRLCQRNTVQTAWILEQSVDHNVALLCSVLSVSRSAYYAWTTTRLSDNVALVNTMGITRGRTTAMGALLASTLLTVTLFTGTINASVFFARFVTQTTAKQRHRDGQR